MDRDSWLPIATEFLKQSFCHSIHPVLLHSLTLIFLQAIHRELIENRYSHLTCKLYREKRLTAGVSESGTFLLWVILLKMVLAIKAMFT